VTQPGGHPALESLVWPDAPTRAHLAVCTECRQRRTAQADDQARVQHWLRSSAPPPAIPAEVAARLSRAIAVEVDRRERAGAADVTASAQRQARWTPQVWLTAAAVAAVALLGGVVGARLIGPSDPVISAERAVGEPEADSADGRLAGAGEDAARRSESSESGDASVPQGVPPLPGDLAATATRLLDDPSELPPAPTDCGAALASQSRGRVSAAGLLGAAAVRQVLVVVRTDDELVAWWLPSCASGRDEALGATALPAP
jgi:hypothetical protein